MKKRRKLTKKEIKQANKYFALVIPVYFIALLIILVLINYGGSLPSFARYAGIVIAAMVAFIFTRSFFQVKKDVSKGEAEEVEGVITKKTKLGGSKNKPSSGISTSKGSSTPSGATYILWIDKVKFNVKAKHYAKVKEGDSVRLTYLPKSQYILTIEKL